MKWKFFLASVAILLIAMNTCTETEEKPNLDPPVLISPSNGETVSINPPTFVWRSVEGDSCDLVYRFEAATDSSFAMGSIIISTIVLLPETTYTPADTFSADTYYWHMSVRQNA